MMQKTAVRGFCGGRGQAALPHPAAAAARPRHAGRRATAHVRPNERRALVGVRAAEVRVPEAALLAAAMVMAQTQLQR